MLSSKDSHHLASVLPSPPPDFHQADFPRPRPMCLAALHSPLTGGAPNPRAVRMKTDTHPGPRKGGDLKWELPHCCYSSSRQACPGPYGNSRPRSAVGRAAWQPDCLGLKPASLGLTLCLSCYLCKMGGNDSSLPGLL